MTSRTGIATFLTPTLGGSLADAVAAFMQHLGAGALDWSVQVEILLHPTDGTLLLVGHEAHHGAGGAGAGGAARAVEVVLVIGGRIEVND